MPINQNQLDGINKSLLEMANLKNKISSDFKAYLENVKHLGVLQQNIKYLEEVFRENHWVPSGADPRGWASP